MAAGLNLPRGRSLVFIGFMGAGKTTAARSAAEALATEAVDVDALIERRLGKPIERVFADEGEATFRAAEERTTLELLDGAESRVLALGGGAIGSERVRAALRAHFVAWVDVGVHTAWERCRRGSRPLARELAGFERLHAEREPVYASLADLTLPSERSDAVGAILGSLTGLPERTRVLWAASASADYPAYIGPGAVTEDRFWPRSVEGQRFLVTDGAVGRLYGDLLAPLAGRVAIMPGEQSKTVAHAEIVWTELVRAGMTRSDIVVALGGGVVGDLAGFCAATYQRGARYVQVPTTLVAQVDSAYGGKTGVDLPEAKNYIGAYHQPSAVIVDPIALSTLPQPELAAGYAEVVKTALIAGGGLWDRIRSGADVTDPAVIAACARTKLRIVAQDERDAASARSSTLGHTVGHAIEAVTGYARYRHGEAVGLGLLAALRLSGRRELRADVCELLDSRGLPTTLDGADPDAVVMATARDKKRLGSGPVPFVLLEAPGAPRPGCPVDARDLISAVRELTDRGTA